MRRRFLEIHVFDYTRYMTIESLEDGLFIQVPSPVEYTIDGTWKRLEAKDSIEVRMGQFVSFKKTYVTGLNFGTFIINGRCNLHGNCMSMIFGDSGYKNNDLSELYRPFHSMFKNCAGIVNVDSTFLPATTLADYCYTSMFQGCTSLVNAPKLPATTLKTGCYDSMFYGCISLTTALALPATTLARFCYDSMLYNCTSLTTAPELPATTLASNCYDSMFYNCTNLTTAPELPATTLEYACYRNMFTNCTKLNCVKMLATDISASGCLSNWVYDVASTGTFVKHPDMTSLPTGYHGIPEGWTVINDGEESGLTFPLYISLNNATQIDENYYEFEPSELSQSLLDWSQEIGLNFDAVHGGGYNTGSHIDLTSKNENYKIIIGDYELTQVTTDSHMSEIAFSNEENTCELCIAKDNSFVEFYIF